MNATLGLRKVERAAILCNKWTITLREQIADVNQRFDAIWQDMAMDGLPHIET